MTCRTTNLQQNENRFLYFRKETNETIPLELNSEEGHIRGKRKMSRKRDPGVNFYKKRFSQFHTYRILIFLFFQIEKKNHKRIYESNLNWVRPGLTFKSVGYFFFFKKQSDVLASCKDGNMKCPPFSKIGRVYQSITLYILSNKVSTSLTSGLNILHLTHSKVLEMVWDIIVHSLRILLHLVRGVSMQWGWPSM